LTVLLDNKCTNITFEFNLSQTALATAVGSLHPAYSIDVMHKRHNAQRQHIIHSVSADIVVSFFL
jgi:hypothetical protein